MVTEGIIKVWFFFFFSRGVLQLRRGPVTAEICIRSGGAAVCANYSPSSRASLTNTSPQTRAGGRGLGEAAAIPLADGRCGGQERKLQEKSRSRLTHGVTGRGDPPARRGNSVWTWGYFQGITRHFWQERRNFKRQNALLSLFLAKGYNFTAVFFSFFFGHLDMTAVRVWLLWRCASSAEERRRAEEARQCSPCVGASKRAAEFKLRLRVRTHRRHGRAREPGVWESRLCASGQRVHGGVHGQPETQVRTTPPQQQTCVKPTERPVSSPGDRSSIFPVSLKSCLASQQVLTSCVKQLKIHEWTEVSNQLNVYVCVCVCHHTCVWCVNSRVFWIPQQ